MIKAAIDIGTNTAHILIAEVIDNRIVQILYKKRFYVYLAENGINEIHEDAINRLFESLDAFAEAIQSYKVQVSICTGTEALRTAKNGSQVVKSIKEKYNLDIETITGIQEAKYIYQGVKQFLNLDLKNYLIVDIGGGSVEFISVEKGTISGINSYPIGIANLYNRFHHSEPIQTVQIDNINSYLKQVIGTTLSKLKSLNINLIGSAGTFEIFGADVNLSKNPNSVSTTQFSKLMKGLILLNEEERSSNALIPKERAKYIVVALLLIDYIIRELDLTEFLVSPYALKEGMIISI